jgi:hypothetical protein
MKSVILAGAAVLLLGIIGVAIPVFNTQHTDEVAKLGSVHVQATETESHVIPPLVSEGAILVGIILIGVGAYARH